jgi:NitT/TauT family transport system substrate-binding protein
MFRIPVETNMRPDVRLLAVLTLAATLVACGDAPPAAGAHRVVRAGHFPNVTHAQGLVAESGTRAGKGWFEERIGPDVSIRWFNYNAGPSAMEALLAGELDFTYVGPSPALNAYVKSKGEDIRVVAGAARGGAALVVHGDGRIAKAADFRGKKVATPQLGNTQDVACRAWLTSNGFKVTPTSGDVTVVPTPNPDQLSGMLRGDLDAVWTVEPWVSRIETEAKGRVLVEETDAVTTVLVASAKFLRDEPELARRIVKAHGELTSWIVANPAEAQRLVVGELKAETKSAVSAELVAHCWPRLKFDASIAPGAFDSFVAAAKAAGFLKDAGDLSRFVQVPR